MSNTRSHEYSGRALHLCVGHPSSGWSGGPPGWTRLNRGVSWARHRRKTEASFVFVQQGHAHAYAAPPCDRCADAHPNPEAHEHKKSSHSALSHTRIHIYVHTYIHTYGREHLLFCMEKYPTTHMLERVALETLSPSPDVGCWWRMCVNRAPHRCLIALTH